MMDNDEFSSKRIVFPRNKNGLTMEWGEGKVLCRNLSQKEGKLFKTDENFVLIKVLMNVLVLPP